mmetsp:Transcript_2935/g.4272  ORF Transcript_2935/g.4272 Transcript_2935/m.4272 type:complete len:482 (-) Transcript_2935:1951-3396(-)
MNNATQLAIQSLNQTLQELKASTDGNIEDTNNGFLLLCGILVFFMQCGFAFLEAGSVRAKNVSNILMKNLVNACITALGWFFVGFGLSFGDSANAPFINPIFGTENFLLLSDNGLQRTIEFFYQWTFCAAATSIVSGALAERMELSAYFISNFFMSTLTFPIVAHAVWSRTGWISPANTEYTHFRLFNGMYDVAGGGVVHLLGGVYGLVGTIMLKPRIGRFLSKEQKEKGLKSTKLYGHNRTYMILGGFLIWFAWYGFNAGSAGIAQGQSQLGGLSVTNTTLSGCTCAVVTMIIQCIRLGYYNLNETLNGILAGCVCVTPICGYIEPWAAVVCGCFCSVVYLNSKSLLEKLKIDDPLNAIPIHGFSSIYGILFGAIFGKPELIKNYYNFSFEPYAGLMYTGSFILLVTHIIGILFIVVWGALMAFLTFFIIDRTVGLRVSSFIEIEGLDFTQAGQAYPSSAADQKMLMDVVLDEAKKKHKK